MGARTVLGRAGTVLVEFDNSLYNFGSLCQVIASIPWLTLLTAVGRVRGDCLTLAAYFYYYY